MISSGSVSQIEAAIIDDDLVKYERVKKKGYVRLNTNFGPLNLELFCDQIPKACDNFIKHCANGYYNNVMFHRSIRNFIVSLMHIQRKLICTYNCFCFRYKVVIPRAVVLVANPFGARSLRTSSSPI